MVHSRIKEIRWDLFWKKAWNIKRKLRSYTYIEKKNGIDWIEVCVIVDFL